MKGGRDVSGEQHHHGPSNSDPFQFEKKEGWHIDRDGHAGHTTTTTTPHGDVHMV